MLKITIVCSWCNKIIDFFNDDHYDVGDEDICKKCYDKTYGWIKMIKVWIVECDICHKEIDALEEMYNSVQQDFCYIDVCNECYGKM